MRKVLGFMVAGLWAMGCGAATAGEGLHPEDHWPQWQLRISTVSQPIGWSTSLEGARLGLGAASVSGDRYLGFGQVGDGGGLRATGALLFGPPSLALGAPGPTGGESVLARPSLLPTPGTNALDRAPTPYLGMGYTAWWARSGLSLSADLGLLAQGLHPATGPQGSDLLDRMQLTPVMQVQLSYRF